MTPDELWKSMSEVEVALLISIGMVMFSVIELGANREALNDRLTTHENNFSSLGQPKAAAIISMMKQFVASTVQR